MARVDGEIEQEARPEPQQDAAEQAASVAVCEENLAALLRALDAGPAREPAIAPPAAAHLPASSSATLPPATSAAPLPVPAIESAPQRAVETTPAPDAHEETAPGPAETPETLDPRAAASATQEPTVEAQPQVISRLALIASIKQRRAATARSEPQISATADQDAMSSGGPTRPALASASAADSEAASALDAGPAPAEQHSGAPEESETSAPEPPKPMAHAPEREAPVAAMADLASAQATPVYSTPAASTLFASADEPREDVTPSKSKRFAISGPTLGVAAGILLAVGLAAFLMLGHASQSRVSKPSSKESFQKTSTAGQTTPAAPVEEKSSIAAFPQAVAGSDDSRKNDKRASTPEPAQPAPAAPAQPAPAAPGPSSEAAPVERPEASRTMARTFTPPRTEAAAPKSSTILEAPPALSTIPSAPSTLPSALPLPSGLRPPAPAPAAPTRQINVAGSVQATKLISRVTPVYPPVARSSGVQGTVRMRVTIGTDGQVETLTTLSGPPPLVEPAANAVKQWRYRPTVLDGKPVEVVTEIDVTFVP